MDGLFCILCLLFGFLYFERLLDRVKLECDRLNADIDKVTKENQFLNDKIYRYECLTGINIVKYLDAEEDIFDGEDDVVTL